MGMGCFCSFDAGSHCPPILRMPHLAFPLNEMAEGLGRVGQNKIQLVDHPEYLAILRPRSHQWRGLTGSLPPLPAPFAWCWTGGSFKLLESL